MSNLSGVEVPKTVNDAIKKLEWKAAIMEEIHALEKKNGTLKVVEKSKDKATIGCRWVFIVKYKSNRMVKHKARLVAKGCTQTYGVDYLENFAPVAKINTIRVLLFLATNLDWQLQQLDVKNTFLNCDLEKKNFMDLPTRFNQGGQGKVCK